jgi:mRNA interferase MazF
MATPDRGDVWLVDLGYAAKTRPCLVLSIPTLDTDRALTTVIPYTSQVKGTRFEVDVSPGFLNKGVFDVQNAATTPHAKFLKKLGKLNSIQLGQVEDAVRHWLGL